MTTEQRATVEVSGTASSGNMEGVSVHAQFDQTDVSLIPSFAPRDIPPAIDRGQAIYWTYSWQVGEKETRKALAEGQGKTFSGGQEAIRWLLSNDA